MEHMKMGRLGRVLAVTAAVLVAFAAAPAGAAYADGAGSIAGMITRPGGGAVTVNLWTTVGGSAGQVSTDADGRYTFASVPAGQYKVQFGVQSGFDPQWQWAYQKFSFSSATVIDVTAGNTTEVDDRYTPSSGVRLTVTDANSGAPVDAVCASQYSGLPGDCGATGGVLTLDGLRAGTYDIYISSSDGLHAAKTVNDVKVASGGLTDVPVALTPTGAITTTVLDRATGDPVPDVCVVPLTMTFGAFTSQMCQFGADNYSKQDGTVTLGGLSPGTYTLLANPEYTSYGLQWVGGKGGTGSQYNAKKITVVTGQSVAAPTIRLDPAASITGVITDAATGESLTDGCASVLPWRHGDGNSAVGPFCIEYWTDGKYTIPNLGPYAWPVQFSYFYAGDTYATYWSGGASNRKDATLVTAGTDTPGEADATLTQVGPGLTVTANSSDGQPLNGYVNVDVFNAKTGDYVKTMSYTLTLDGVAAQPVRLQYFAGGDFQAGWYGGDDFATATNVKVNPDKPKTVRLTLEYTN
jgi:5-hydroxyisourate hydrolase-like protein (transthyretin family)